MLGCPCHIHSAPPDTGLLADYKTVPTETGETCACAVCVATDPVTNPGHRTRTRVVAMLRLAVVVLGILVTGCAASLTQAGSMVRDMTNMFDTIRAECTFLGVVEAEESAGSSLASDERGALARIRNEVANRGGDAFLLLSLNTTSAPISNSLGTFTVGGAAATAEAYYCGLATR